MCVGSVVVAPVDQSQSDTPPAKSFSLSPSLSLPLLPLLVLCWLQPCGRVVQMGKFALFILFNAKLMNLNKCHTKIIIVIYKDNQLNPRL